MNNVKAARLPQQNRKILIVGNFASAWQGNRGVCEDLAERLAPQGWTVTTTSRSHFPLARLADMLLTIWRSRRRYKVAQVDMFSGRAFFWAVAVCRTLQLVGKPFILTLHGGNLPAFASKHPGLVRRTLNFASVVTTPSRYLHEEMSPYRKDLYLLPNPLDLQAYEFRLRASARPQLVWLRAFHEIYNPLLAAQTMRLLVKDFPNSHLTMVGPDKGDGSLQKTQKAILEYGLAANVTITGPVTKADVPTQLGAADILLNTARVDNTPISVMEAMACGLCVVSTNVGGIPYLLDDGQDALLVANEDPAAMAQAVKRILDTPRLAEQLSTSARRKAEGFDWPLVLQKWDALLTSVVKKTLPSEHGGS